MSGYGIALCPTRATLCRVARGLVCALLVTLLLALAQTTRAATNIYAIRGNATPGSNNIYRIDPNTGALTTVFSNYLGGTFNAATFAQRPSDGMLFFAVDGAGGANGQVYRFNPATPSIAPVALSSTLGAGTANSFRMAFSPAGVLYYMVGANGVAAQQNKLYIIDQTTGAAGGAVSLTGTSNGGDMAFAANGTLYIVDQTRVLYSASTAGGAATTIDTIDFSDGNTANTIGIAFDATGRMMVQTVSTNNGTGSYNFYALSPPFTAPLGTAAAVGLIGGGNTSTGDLASATVPDPSLSITKTDGQTTVYQGQNFNYSIVVTNNGTYAVTGTVADTVPTALTNVTWTCTASAGSTCTAANGSGNSINTSATLAGGGTATYIVNGTVADTATGALNNTATVTVPAWLTDSTPANNTATDSDTINIRADLSITKTDGRANINPGAAITYTIVVSNAAAPTSAGTATNAPVTDTVPALITGVAWTCGLPTGGATCGAASGSGNTISTTATLPVGSSVTYTVTGTLSPTASGTLTNTAKVVAPAGVYDPTDPAGTGAGNNSATDSTTINPAADLSLTKTVNNATPSFNQNVTFTITLTNAGPAAATGVSVTDRWPASGLTFVSATPSVGTYSNATKVWTVGNVAVGASLTLQIVATVTAAGTITNTAEVTASGLFDPDSTPNNNNAAEDDQASVSLTAATPPQIALDKSVAPSGAVVPGAELTYTVTFTNNGGTAAASFILYDMIPANTVFKVGSVTYNANGSGIPAPTVNYSQQARSAATPPAPPSPWSSYAPPGAAGTFDATVNWVRWNFNANPIAPGKSATVTFIVRIQ